MLNFLLYINKILSSGQDVPIGWCEGYDGLPSFDDIDSIRARFEEMMDVQAGHGSFVIRVECRDGSTQYEGYFTIEQEEEEPECEDDEEEDVLGLDDYYRFCRGE